MSEYIFKRQQLLPIKIDQVWDFFSNPRNLCRITPASLDFKIMSQVPEKISEGLEIEYRVKPLLGIPVLWLSRIKDVKPPFQFVDVQLKGPYRYWHHHHFFQETLSGVLMTDTINYEVPLSRIFPWLNDVIVVKELNRIFNFRQETLKVMFGERKGS